MDTALILGLAGLGTTLAGSLAAPQLAVRSQRALTRIDELRGTLDDAAVELAACEAAGRSAWRALLELELQGDRALDDALRDTPELSDFPPEPSTENNAAVLAFATTAGAVEMMVSRLTLRLGEDASAVKAFSSARDHLDSVATTMRFAADGIIGGGGTDVEQTIEVFFKAVSARAEFLREARALID
jgi:hypothetical protein